MRESFLQRARKAIAAPTLQVALERNAAGRQAAWKNARASIPGIEELRLQAKHIRKEVIDDLDLYVKQLTNSLIYNGWHVHSASDAGEACRLVVEIAQAHGAKLVAKSKSMVTEEIGLNHALEQAGIRAVETDLGEFIVQLRGEAPGHITTPAVHLRREDVAETFARELGMTYTTDVKAMTDLARNTLRQVFLQAPIGISGVNFAVPETGTVCLVTNEGNGRMVTTVPPVHIAVMGIERIVLSLDGLAPMLQLLPRAGTGQKITSYVTLIQAPRHDIEPDGPLERHLILVDNGRSAMARGRMREALHCIRCGACLNACPVFGKLGGHAYDSVYPGPIGSVISPQLFSMAGFGHLAKASTLCGACQEACPVSIDLPTLLLHTRHAHSRQLTQTTIVRLAMRVFSWFATSPGRYRLGQRMAALASRFLTKQDGWLRELPPPLDAWTMTRDFPPFAPQPFRERWQALVGSSSSDQSHAPSETKPGIQESKGIEQLPPRQDSLASFTSELQAAGGEVIRCSAREAPTSIATLMQELEVTRVLAWDSDSPPLAEVLAHLRSQEIMPIDPAMPSKEGPDWWEKVKGFEKAQAGLTGAAAGLADTGTIIVPSGPGRSTLASLLPPVHIAVLSSRALFPDLASWLKAGGDRTVADSSSIALITGPSRTADIEMTLTIGVHGPARLIVFLVD